MLDITLLREKPELIKKNISRRGANYNPSTIDEFLQADRAWRELKGEQDNLRQERNTITLDITKLKQANKDASKLITKAKQLPEQIKKNEEHLHNLRNKLDTLLKRIPNLLHSSVPTGKDETENQVIKLFGKKPKLTFQPLSHVDLLQKNDWADLERAAKISGARWYFLKGELALLEQSLARYAIDFLIKRKYTLIIPPHMINRKAYEGVTDLEAFQETLYKLENEDLYTIATSEHPLTAMYTDETLPPEQLPLKIAGYSVNFRKEAGAHGKDTKGIFRVHQFNKVEQLILCRPEDSWKHHEELIKNAIDFFKTLDLHFRQVNICTGEIGTIAAKKYDLEAWYPAQNAYREVVSCSNCTSYQATRLGIKYTAPEGNRHVHTLNSTMIATSRALVALLENHQQKDGSVKIPKPLQKYINNKKKIGGKV